MNSLLSSLTHLRTTVPGLGVYLLVASHYWTTGHLTMDDIGLLLAGTGLVGAEKPKG